MVATRSTRVPMDQQKEYETVKSRVEAGKLQSIDDLSSLLLRHPILRVDDSCWLNGEQQAEYELDFHLNDIFKVTLAGPNSNAVEGTLTSLLALGLTSSTRMMSHRNQGSPATTTTMTIQAFATQPRCVLPKLGTGEISFLNAASCSSNTNRGCTQIQLRIHFCSIPACPIWKDLFNNYITLLELRQCSIKDWNYIGSPSTLILSLTMADFQTFGLSTVIVTNVQTLHLVLHYSLQQDHDAWTTFCHQLFQARDIHTLEIQYLDIGDVEWELLWTNLPKSIQSVTMRFTEGFVDDHRRLTAERRLQRTNVVENAVKSTDLRSVSFPECQQDQDAMHQIHAILHSR